MNNKLIIDQLNEMLIPILESMGYGLVEIEFINDGGRWVLRIYIDSESGIVLENCEEVSRHINPILDVEDIIPCAYTLEVSSPGINRPIRFEAHFQKYAGTIIQLKTTEPIDGRRNYKGQLLGMVDHNIMIIVDGEQYTIPHALLAKAHVVEWPETLNTRN